MSENKRRGLLNSMFSESKDIDSSKQKNTSTHTKSNDGESNRDYKAEHSSIAIEFNHGNVEPTEVSPETVVSAEKDSSSVKKKGLLGMFSSEDSGSNKSSDELEKEELDTEASVELEESQGRKESSDSISSSEIEDWYKDNSEIDDLEEKEEEESGEELFYEDVFTGEKGEIISPRSRETSLIEKVDRNLEDKDSGESLEEEVEFSEVEEDLLSSMLASLEDEEDLETAKKRASLDSEVVAPLEKDRGGEIVVTSDGKTLNEMIAIGRKGSKSTKQKLRELDSQEGVVEVGGKKFSDSVYLKHVKSEEDKREREEKRIKDSLKFIRKHAKFTEQEKLIMRNLGLSGDKFAKIMKSAEVSKSDKLELLSSGRYGEAKNFKGKRYRTTVGDTAIIEYLAKFKFANTRILRWLKDERQDRTWRKLNRLRDSGLVESHSIIGIPDLWGSTPAGIGISGYSHDPGLRPFPKLTTISSTMGVNYLAACLWFNTVNVLNLDDFPAENRVIADQEDGRNRARGEMLVSEYEIRRSLGQEISPQTTTMQTLGDERLYDIISSNVREEFDNWELNGKVGESPEFALGNEYMWVLYPTSQLTLSYHVPDLVVKRERGSNGEPRSIAVEVERHEKSSARYDQIMLAYKLDEHLYEKVIWVTPNTRTARALEKAAREVGFERYSILPIITKTGIYSKQDMWMI